MIVQPVLTFADRLKVAFTRGSLDVEGLGWEQAVRQHETLRLRYDDPDLLYAYDAGFLQAMIPEPVEK
jgi:hypothetical protein